LDAATDCPTGQGCCGNKKVDPGETCDDGNFVSGKGDFCPAGCFIASCTPVPASSFGIHVTYTHPAGTTISGLGIFVDYPEGKVRNAAKGTLPFGVSIDLNDLTYAFSIEALKLGGLPATLAPITFQTCDGAAAATAGDFTCTVTDASDDLGNVVDPSTLSCAITVP
jgi:cysteine-rich repeat protein